MKRLVDIVQLLLIAIILSPVYFFWQSEKVDVFCSDIKTPMSLAGLKELADKHSFEIIGLDDANVDFGKWQGSVVTKWPFVDDYCQIRGLGDTVSKAKFIDE